jgi:hypothetical protein
MTETELVALPVTVFHLPSGAAHIAPVSFPFDPDALLKTWCGVGASYALAAPVTPGDIGNVELCLTCLQSAPVMPPDKK